jgi:hypothetical protein
MRPLFFRWLRLRRDSVLLVDLVEIVLLVQLVHLAYVDKYEDYKAVDRALLSHPETKFETADAEIIEKIYDQNAADEGDEEPDAQQGAYNLEISLPIRASVCIRHRWPRSFIFLIYRFSCFLDSCLKLTAILTLKISGAHGVQANATRCTP